MKKLIIILVISLFLPVVARADVISYQKAWAFLYDFSLSWNGSVLAPAQQYKLATGDAPVLPVGNWTLTLTDAKGRILAEHRFDPAFLAVAGHVNLLVPYFDRGTTARFSDATGLRVFDVDLQGSRVCNDDDICDFDSGENSDTCPTDCGSAAFTSAPATIQIRTAAIAQQVSTGQELGLWVLRLALGAAGFMLLVGVARMLDSHRAP